MLNATGAMHVTICSDAHVQFDLLPAGLRRNWPSCGQRLRDVACCLTLLALCLSRRHYSFGVLLGFLASVCSFGTYHLLLLVLCQSQIFLDVGVEDVASMGFNPFFLNGLFCRSATRCIQWVDGLDLRELEPFVADLGTAAADGDDAFGGAAEEDDALGFAKASSA